MCVFLDDNSMCISSSGSKKETIAIAIAPLREEKAINEAHKLLLESTTIIDYCLFNPNVEGA